MYIFGSFVTAKTAPADLDLFLVMSGDFASALLKGVLVSCSIESGCDGVGVASTGSLRVRIVRLS